MYYKCLNNRTHWLDDSAYESLLPEGSVRISEEEALLINEENERLRIAALSYQEKRVMSYPPITEYLDGVVKGDQAQIDAYIAACLAVKDMYPKT